MEEETAEHVEVEIQRLGFARLIAVLLSPRTFPHLLLLTVVTSYLYYSVKGSEDGGVFGAIAYIAFAAAYVIIALAARSERWRDLIHTTAFKETETKGFTAWAIHQLQQLIKVWIPPLLLSAIILGILHSMFNEGGGLEAWSNGIPLLLAGLFIAWSMGQAISFRMTIKGFMFARPMFMDDSSRKPHLLSSSIVQIIIVQSCAILLLWAFQSAAWGKTVSAQLILKEHFPYLLVLLAGQIAVLVWARPFREKAGRHKGASRASMGLGLLIQLFAAWHLLSIWRRFNDFGEPEIISTVEELTLMILTVILAIYGLSSRSLQVDSKYFTEQNALFWGLTFGFGYAGSIAMIAILLRDVATVLMLGHAITYLTLMYLHNSSIRKLPWTDDQDDESADTDTVIEDVENTDDDTVEEEDNSTEPVEELEENDDEVEVEEGLEESTEDIEDADDDDVEILEDDSEDIEDDSEDIEDDWEDEEIEVLD